MHPTKPPANLYAGDTPDMRPVDRLPNSRRESCQLVSTSKEPRKASDFVPSDGPVLIYISKRPFNEEPLLPAYRHVLECLLNNKDVDYRVYLETSVEEHPIVKEFTDRGKFIFFKDLIPADVKINFVITIGGDGTILWAHKMFNQMHLPLFLCFNGGTLCFLSNFKIEDVEQVMDFFTEHVSQKKEFKIKRCPRLHSFVCNSHECESFNQYVLNDVVIERLSPSVVVLDLFINGSFAVQMKADGLLVSSSTGSTAYNLSLANGIIMHSDVECIIINPMASMSLSSRPIVVPKTAEIKIVNSVESRNESRLVYDGSSSCPFAKGDYLLITSCPEGLNMIVPPQYEEYASWILKLKELRGWN